MSDTPLTKAAPEDDGPDMTAAELALGLLEGEARAAAMRRVLAEPGFARAVEQWRAHFAHLFAAWPAMDAPDVLARIERSIDHASSMPIAFATPARAAGGGWGARMWPGIAALSSIAAAGLLVMLFAQGAPAPPVPQPRPSTVAPAPAPLLVAAIVPSAKGTPVSALYDARVGEIRLTGATLGRAGRSAELWVIPAGEATPHALGLLQAQGGTALKLRADQRARIAAGATLAVSIEPVGGSPTGLPTGPVVATGALATV